MNRDLGCFPYLGHTGFGTVLQADCRTARVQSVAALEAAFRSADEAGAPICVRGAGLSYGDAGFAADALVVDVSGLNRVLNADWQSGRVEVECGVTIRDLMALALPRGWMLPVTPGSSSVTVGGAIAFDIHGKNHGVRGGFSRCVDRLTLLDRQCQRRTVDRTGSPELFSVVIGGFGLAGMVETAVLQLAPLPGNGIQTRTTGYRGADDLPEAIERSESEFCLAWYDLLNASSLSDMHWLLMESDYVDDGSVGSATEFAPNRGLPVGLLAPFYNRLSNKVFNHLYRAKGGMQADSRAGLRSFLFPWDGMPSWNKLYGRQGFFEYQVVLPGEHARDGLPLLLEAVLRHRLPVFLAASKRFTAGEGLLSFAAEAGVSLLLDLPATDAVRDHLEELDRIVEDHAGRVHLAKDARLGLAAFSSIYADVLPLFESRLDEHAQPGQFTSGLSERLGVGLGSGLGEGGSIR